MQSKASRRSTKTWVIGLDFGTNSLKAVLIDTRSGKQGAESESKYCHGRIADRLPGSRKRLDPGFVLNHPRDYLDAMESAVPALLRDGKVQADQIIGLGLQFEESIVLPVQKNGNPLCLQARWKANPHAWPKAGGHRTTAVTAAADRINELAQLRLETFLNAYGGHYDKDWFFSKTLETVDQASAVYTAADRFLEAGDWLVWQLCGREHRSAAAAGFRAMRVNRTRDNDWTYPDRSFFRVLNRKLEDVAATKLGADYLPPAAKAGGLVAAQAKRLGLSEGIAVAVAGTACEALLNACGVASPGKLVMQLGSSSSHFLMARRKRDVQGMRGVVEDGALRGLWSYEAWQAGSGEMLEWYVRNGVGTAVADEAARHKRGIAAWLDHEAAALKPGQSGLLALDWWAGNRSAFRDDRLSGLILGLRLESRPHEIFRALLEAAAFGARRIVESFQRKELPVQEIYLTGDLLARHPAAASIYAEVMRRPVRTCLSENPHALGAAISAAVAAGVWKGLAEAAPQMGQPNLVPLPVDAKNAKTYHAIYTEYARLYEAFGGDDHSPMKAIATIRKKST